jgi:multidrug efflux pump subunit AcrA (membrane-fusion protein)
VIDVAVGQQVTQGQILARVDPTTAQQNLAVAQANLTAAQDRLAQMQQVETPQQAAQDSAVLAQSQQQVNSAQTSLNDARALVAFDQSQNQTAVNAASAQLAADQASHAAAAALAQDQSKLASAQAAQTQSQIKDQQTLDQSQNALTTAQLSLASTQASNAVKSQPPQPGDVAAQQASILQAQNTVAQDQQTLDNTTLVAPADGVVASISGQVGQVVSGSGSGSSSSGGASATPAASSASSGSSGSSGSAGSGATSGAGASSASGANSSTSSATPSSSSSSSSSSSTASAFLTLTNLQSMNVAAGFTETDVAKVQLNQPTTMTISALPGQTFSGHVIQIDTLQTVVSNVVTYNVTSTLDNTPTSLKPGMTANVSVVVGQRAGVLRVPNAAVTTRGNASSVQVLGSDNKPTAVSVVAGLKGDTFTEIQSGLTPGQRIVVSSGATTGGTGGQIRLPTGGGGLGGGGLGGGGLGGGGATRGGG